MSILMPIIRDFGVESRCGMEGLGRAADATAFHDDNDVLTLAHFPEIMMERGEGGLGVYHGSFDRLVVIVGTSVDFKSV